MLPGDWRPTAPNVGVSASLYWYQYITPFALTSASQFRSGPPPALNSARYAADVNEVKALGGLVSSARTPAQTQIALFNNDAIGIHYNRLARTLVSKHADLLDTARLFALLNIALSDASEFSADAKYFYNRWRPISAINLADTAGNPAVQADPLWAPLTVTPNHPDYPSRHAAGSGAGTAILDHFFGTHKPFTDTSTSLPGVTRHYESFDDFLNENIVARIYIGVHTRSATEAGAIGGQKVGEFAIATKLRPLYGHDDAGVFNLP
ncbi:hypothetical protein CCAX7_63730 [Capsulimonas corticalis]|uniref:Uncharacterized protein n=1 Tax=Capsulimonas corticalis TaxID=2219043 RepID=A0A402CX33_9BACT|nr:vanadium-dependent haloperoxidase [Capsulimonas corticalis]BDI34322.1 hypothetical protein CCAX7_63730 [Capsulimonas corticalis]